METRNKILFGIAIIFLIVIGAAAIDVYAQVNTTSGTPDLGVTDLAISNSNPQINEVFTVTFTVTNQGTADIDASKPPYSAGYYLYRSDSTHGDSITAAGTLRSLKVGESQTLSFQSSMYSSPTEIYVVIDRENQYAELNENNNKKSLIIYWPDLVVTGMKLYQSDLKIGDNSDGVATIKNIGIADTARAVSLRVYKTDSSGTTLLGTSTRSFRAGESFDVAIGGRIAYSPTIFKVVIDSENLVSESDESNNEGSLTVTAASSASSGGSGGGGTATNQTSGGSGGGGGTSGGSTGGGGGISEPKVLPIYLGPTLDVSTDKYYYTADEQVKVSAVLTGSASTIANAVVAAYVYYSPYCPEGAACAAVVITDKITFQLVGGVVQACEVQEGGITTCPTTQSSSSYYVGYYTPRGAGTYNIIGSARTSDHILAGDEAKFEVIGKAIDVTDYDAIDLSISPEEQKTIIGEPVTYVLTIRDKHKSPDCLRTEPRCLIAERLYTYNLELFGLPYPSSFSQSSVTLSAGQSTDVRLIVYPSSTAIYQQTVTAVVEPVAVTQQVVTEPGAPTVRPIEAVEERLTTKVTAQVVSILPTKASAETESAIAIHHPDYRDETYKSTIRFSVKATQSDNDRNSDKATGILHVFYYNPPAPPEEPPDLPEDETVTLSFNRGWNLVNLPGEYIRSEQSSTCGSLTGFVYVNGRGYVKLDKVHDIIGSGFLKYFSTHSFWVYAKQSCDIKVVVSNFATYSGLKLDKGWNFIGTTKDMIGETLDSIKGTCNIEKAYTFSASENKWGRFGTANLITSPYKGILVKTSGECTLGENTILPPPLPAE